MFLRLFENFVKFPFYSLPLREIRHYSPRFPLRGKWRAAPIEVYLKFRLMLRLPLACIKFCLTSSLPLAPFCYRKNQQKLSAYFIGFPSGGGSAERRWLGAQLVFYPNYFNQGFQLVRQPLAFPFREPLSNCRFKAISASRVASDSEPIEVSPFLKQSPL